MSNTNICTFTLKGNLNYNTLEVEVMNIPLDELEVRVKEIKQIIESQLGGKIFAETKIVKPNIPTAPKVEVKPIVKPTPKVEVKPIVKPAPKVDVKPTPKVDVIKPAPKVDVIKPAPKVDVNNDEATELRDKMKKGEKINKFFNLNAVNKADSLANVLQSITGVIFKENDTWELYLDKCDIKALDLISTFYKSAPKTEEGLHVKG